MRPVVHRTLALLLALLLAAPLPGCVPAPHVAYLRPAVSGVVLENGEPIPGVELFLARYAGANEPCTAVGKAVPVSPEGMFRWTSLQEHKLIDSVLNPVAVRGTVTVLCIRHPTRGVMIGAVIAMKQSTPVSLHLVCDPAHPRTGASGPHVAAAMLGQAQHCAATTIPASPE